ncbi:MAG TPA: FtsX-like permease family protein [Thermoplasmata archaeon]|nr:FtsX-like permease family protein [Thermoplasmata archaeon]
MREALTSLGRRPARTAATVLGIGLATGLVVLLLSLSEGIAVSSTRLATASGVDLLATSANTSLAGGQFPPISGAHGLAGEIPATDPNIVAASPWLISSLTFGNASLYAASNASAAGRSIPYAWGLAGGAAIGWVPGDNAGLEVPPVYSGPGFSSANDTHYANGRYTGPSTGAVVLDQGLEGVLNATVGSLVWVSVQSAPGPSAVGGWYRNATPFRVVGVSGPFWLVPSALLGFFYLSELQSLLGPSATGSDSASVVLIHLKDPTLASNDQGHLSRAFPSLTVFSLTNILGAVQQVVQLYRTFGTLIGLVGVVVATLFTTTVLAMSVDERSREIAVRRALGFSRASTGWLVLEEGLWLGLLGLALGLPIGFAGAFLVNRFLVGLVTGLPAGFSFVAFDPTVLASGLAEVFAIAFIAALGPALYAMRLPVAEELRAP